jgi:hypothetical protein
MSDNEQSNDEYIARLEGIERFVDELGEKNYTWLHLPTIYEYDPVSETPFVLSSSFIPENIGGTISILEVGSGEVLGQENLNQMLGSFLPGGFKQRWGKFDLWQGNYEVLFDSPGIVNIYPMFDTNQVCPLGSLLDEIDTEQFTSLDFDPDQVLIYFPDKLWVNKLDKRQTSYFWATDPKVITAGQSEPPTSNIELSSDPTTNYLWFKQLLSRDDGERIELSSDALVPVCEFVSDVQFLRAYYASLLTLYTRQTNDTLSRIITYRHGREGPPAFVGSHEQSQALFFDLSRSELRSRVENALAANPTLKRDLQVAKLYRLVWDRLFFEANGELLDHVFSVRPFVDQLLGVDYWTRQSESEDGVFALGIDQLSQTLQKLLPEDSHSRLRSMGYDPQSPVFEVISERPELLEDILAECDSDEQLYEFAEEVALHSLEHALSTWATEQTASGGSLELWYDVNFQAKDTDTTTLGIYDPIQGGSGIANEIFTELSETPNSIDDRLCSRGMCHTATTDQIVLRFLASAPGDTLYSLSTSNRTEFSAQIRTAVEETVAERPAEYNTDDLTAHVETRLRSMFETRELARFNAYVGDLHASVADVVGRTPRPVDVVLHLDQHFFRDPRIAATYERFSKATERRDLSELAERIEAITMQCVSACPDCLQVDGPSCVHGMKYQTQLLNRRLLTAISDTQ